MFSHRILSQTIGVLLIMGTTLYAQKHGVNMGVGNWANADLVQKLADTGVLWAYVPVFWSIAEPSDSGSTYWGPRVSRYHDYNWGGLDVAVNGLMARGVSVVLQIRSQPGWAGGSGCDVTAGTPYYCGKILTAYKQNFRDNFYDFAYHLAERYPQVMYWAIGNEPNLDEYFSPQPPLLYQSPAAEYMDLMMIPARDAITSLIPTASVFGAELFTCYNSGAGCTNHDRNWGYDANWNNDWARILLINWPQYFPRFTIHNYSSDDWGIRTAVGDLWDMMVSIGQTRTIWTTEFNFRSGTCDDSEQTIANLTCRNYLYMTWERAFYFDLQGNGCFSLLTNDPGNPPKSFLYPAFQAIVGGTYYCQ